MSIKQLDDAYVASTYRRFPVEIVSGKGSVLTGADGREYIDMGSGIGVTAFGVADDAWQAAVTAQLSRVQHTSNLYYTEPCARLAQMLCERTGMKKVFFSNSGAEANECAIKAARKYASERKGTDCATVVTFKNSFHGRTLTTLAATGQDSFHRLYQPLTPGFCHIDPHAGGIYELEALCARTPVAAVLFECVQGEGGVVPVDGGFLREMAAFCKERDILIMVDEVQTGNGRTGALYSYMNFGLTPDVVSTAKGLGGGLPLGATLLGEKVEDVFAPGDHGSTFGGNPVCCAGAISVLERLDDAFLAAVRQKSRRLCERLAASKGIESVTGLGLMLGLKTVRPAADVVAGCIEKGVLCLTAKDKVRLLPALNIPDDLLMQAADTIVSVCEEGL